MIQVENWLSELTRRLADTFAERLLFVGLQGSYRRGEATEESDIDSMVVLDTLSVNDLKAYRGILSGMGHAGKACGFICGKGQLLCWPKHEIFQLLQETEPYFGDLAGLTPAVSRGDIIESVRISAANLYHDACHTYLYSDTEDYAKKLKSIYKGIFFPIQLAYYLRSGTYCDTKKKLLPLLAAEERELLETGMNWGKHWGRRAANPEEYFQRIIDWCGGQLAT